jgi:hypothetical protein
MGSHFPSSLPLHLGRAAGRKLAEICGAERALRQTIWLMMAYRFKVWEDWQSHRMPQRKAAGMNRELSAYALSFKPARADALPEQSGTSPQQGEAPAVSQFAARSGVRAGSQKLRIQDQDVLFRGRPARIPPIH